MNYQIIQKRKIFLTISGLLIAISIFALFRWGLNFGVDFSGGSLMEAEFINYQPTITEIQDSLHEININNLVIQPTEDNTYILRYKDTGEDTHQKILTQLGNLADNHEGVSFKELRLDLVGPSVGKELKSKSFNSSLIVLIMIVVYISLAFRRVSKPVASWKYGVTAIIALIHDVIITLGAFAFLGHFFYVEINTPFIAAILTVLGYSVSDNIVVFDRIRDNLPRSHEDFENTVNTSVNQTLFRSICTSVSTMLALTAILLFGGDTIKDFALALLIGIFVGTYSSIFIASPLLVVWYNFMKKKQTKTA